jgi:LysM repeat protein
VTLIPDQVAFAQSLSQLTGLNLTVLEGWIGLENNPTGNTGANNFLNIKAASIGQTGGEWATFPTPAAAAEAAFKLLSIPYNGYPAILASAGASPQAQIDAIAASKWDSGHYALVPDGPPGGALVNAYNAVAVTPLPATPPSPPAAVTVAYSPVPGTPYVIQPGDNLYDIAEAHGLDWHALYAANEGAIGADPAMVHPGTVIMIPSPVPPSGKLPAAAPPSKHTLPVPVHGHSAPHANPLGGIPAIVRGIIGDVAHFLEGGGQPQGAGNFQVDTGLNREMAKALKARINGVGDIRTSLVRASGPVSAPPAQLTGLLRQIEEIESALSKLAGQVSTSAATVATDADKLDAEENTETTRSMFGSVTNAAKYLQDLEKVAWPDMLRVVEGALPWPLNLLQEATDAFAAGLVKLPPPTLAPWKPPTELAWTWPPPVVATTQIQRPPVPNATPKPAPAAPATTSGGTLYKTLPNSAIAAAAAAAVSLSEAGQCAVAVNTWVNQALRASVPPLPAWGGGATPATYFANAGAQVVPPAGVVAGDIVQYVPDGAQGWNMSWDAAYKADVAGLGQLHTFVVVHVGVDKDGHPVYEIAQSNVSGTGQVSPLKTVSSLAPSTPGTDWHIYRIGQV